MAEEQKDQEKTEQPTPKRREEAREKGQVARSQEVASVTVLIAGLTYLYFDSNRLIVNIMAMIKTGIMESGKQIITANNIYALSLKWVYELLIFIAPMLLTVFVAGLLANFIQVGFTFSTKSIAPKISKINPLKGFQRLFSVRSLAELVKNILKLCIVAGISYLSISGEIEELQMLVDKGTGGILIYLGQISLKIVLNTALVLVVLALLDYIYQRWEYEKGLKMSRQEVKDEYKQTDGDPLVKARIRRIQREMARRRMMANIPKADVVITNPEHLAIALSYDQEKMYAPVVAAKGSGFIAEKIKEIARQNKVPVVENKPLAQVLYRMVRIGEVIPEQLYKAVAEILAYVYSLKNKRIVGQ